MIGVVQQQHVEALDPAAREAALGRHADVVAVAAGGAQSRIGEPREALRALALALVEVVADRPDQAVALARASRQRGAERAVGVARAVGVGRDDGVDPFSWAQQRQQALVLQRLAEVHEATAAPGPDRGRARPHAPTVASAQRPALASEARRGARPQRGLQALQRMADGVVVAVGVLRRPRRVGSVAGDRSARRVVRRGRVGVPERHARTPGDPRAQLVELVDAQREVLATLAAQL